MEMWPDDTRSDQVHAEQIRDRERVQQDIQEAWDNLMGEVEYPIWRDHDSDIKLLKWALSVK